MSCVNIKSKEFTALAEQTNVSVENLEAIVHAYQNELGTDSYPTAEYVRTQLTGNNEAESNAQLELWAREYSTDLLFSTKEELDKAYQNAVKYFGEQAITTFINGKGYRVLRVAEPKKLKGNKIIGTNLTLDASLIDYFYDKVSPTNPYHQVYKQMVDTLRANDIPISIVEDNTLGRGVAARAQDGFKTATIRFNRAKLQELLMTYPKDHVEGNLFRILTHELVHALTAEILETHPSWSNIRGFDEAQTKFANEIDALYNEAVEAFGDEGWYGLTNKKEFISEAMTNRNFQRRLSEVKSNKKQSFWDRFINSITSLFKKVFAEQDMDINNTLLDDVITVSEEYFTYAYKGLNRGIDDYKGKEDGYISSRNQGLAILHKLKDVDNTVTDNAFKLVHQSWGNKSVFFYQVPKNSGLTNVELNERAYSLLEEKLKDSQATIADYKIGPELTTIYRNGKAVGYGFKVNPRKFSDINQTVDTNVDESWNPYLEDAQARQDEIDKDLEMLGRDDYSDGGEDTSFNISSEDPFLVEQGELSKQIDTLLNSSLMTSSEVREIAEQVVYAISDHITDMQEHPEKAEQIYGEIAKGIDWTNSTRLEIVNAVGADNLIAYAKEVFSPRAGKYAKRSTNKKAKLIIDNWKGIMRLAYDVFNNLEDFSLVKVEDTTQAVEQSNTDVDNPNTQSKEDIEETQGSLQEHWQVESRTLDVITSMSQLVKQALAKCYILTNVGTDESSNPIYDKVPTEFGVNKRVNTRDAVNSILRWTQGSTDLPMMIEALKRRVERNPWISQVIEKLEDESGKYTDFQSQFYSTFAKHFQTYDVVVLEDGKYVTKTVNVDPAMKQVTAGIKSLFSIGQHPLFNQSGVNKTELVKVKEAHSSLKTILKNSNTLEIGKVPEVAETIAYVSSALGFNILPDDIVKVVDTKKLKSMTDSLGYIINILEANVGRANYDPFAFKEGISGNLKAFLSPLVDAMEDTAVSSFYDSGKMYQSYITPSYMTILMNKFHNEEGIAKFLQEEYGKYDWFREQNPDITRGWRNSWLRELSRDKKAREIFAHKVQLNFNKSNYMRGMSPEELELSIITEYFSETSEGKQSRVPAWFRIPMMSNKPSSEFIRFYSERGINYKETLVDGLKNIFDQELSRIQFTRQHNYTSKDQEFIKNYDKNGKKFQFLDWMNDYLDGDKKDSELGKLINKSIEGKEKLSSKEEAKMVELAKEAIFDYMDSRAKKIIAAYQNNGIVKAAAKITGIGNSETEVAQNLENFVWNDFYASQMILQLTITDTAYYKDSEDLQKRLAQIHAPGVRGNINATDYNGRKVSDGISRNIVLTDFDKVVSNIKENVAIVFDRKIEAAPEHLKAGYKAMKENILSQFDDLNVADAQAYSSPSSYRKKAFIFGKWSRQAEEVYNKLIDGDYTYSDLKVAFQPLKPFVYGQIEKQRGEGKMSRTKVGVQNKNSEYLLILADAILQNEDTGRPNLLRAIYEVMEESAVEEVEEVIDGKKIKRKITKTNGIDTVQFESAVKAGLQNKVDLRPFLSMENGEAEAKAALRTAIYNANGSYNLNTVNEIPFEYYALQQEVPAHFKDHEQAHGSQERYIISSDLEEIYEGEQVYYIVEGRKLTAEQLKSEYEDTIAANIEESLKEVATELCLIDGTRKERNAALSKILQREILSSPRYGIDLLQACSLDENGEFRIPLGDPIQSKRVEQLINSIVKNRINKQTIAGGPVVQVSNFGTSRELNIRFKDKNGGLLKTKSEFAATYKETPSQTDKFNAKYGRATKSSEKSLDKAYTEYIKENQGGIAYMEVFAPIYTQDIFEKFMNEDGSIDMEAIEATNPDLLKMVGYRIPTEDKYSISPLKIVGFLPREAGDGIMLPNDITLLTGSDFDVDKEYLQRKEFNIKERSKKEIRKILTDKLIESKKSQSKFTHADKVFISEQVEAFLDSPEQMRYTDNLMRTLWYEYKRVAYIAEEPTEGRTYRNNKIVDMTYEVLTHASTADKVLNPGGFEEQKRRGYLHEAYRNTDIEWSKLEGKSTSELKDLCYTSKNLGFIDTHVQFYRQNAAAGTILGMFAVQKIAHAALEGDGYMVNIPDVIYSEDSFIIAGMEFGDNMTFDMKYSRDGQLIGKVLGSLVASAADAVKDPVLNLMNINSNTANILTGLIRLGMPFSDASLFLSQKIVTDILDEFSITNISDYKSLKEIISNRIAALEKDHNITNESPLHSEELTREELIHGLRQASPEIEYKTLVALQKVQAIADALRGPTFATRFNSISSAVGPLVIDNLILEHKLTNFSEALRDSNGNTLSMLDIFRKHPILNQFSQTVGMARRMLSDLPTNSSTFRNALESVGKYLENILYNDRKLLSQFSDFFQSYAMVASGAVDASETSYYVNQFANDYMKEKYNTKEEYLDNPFIQAIKLEIDKRTNKPILKIDTTGLDRQQKEILLNGWIDLHKINPELSMQLVKYNFFRGGIGFNPKTFMALMPNYVKERIPNYLNTYRTLPEIVPAIMIDQFIRNNWSNNKLVPKKKPKYILKDNMIEIYKDSDIKEMEDIKYFKNRINNEDILWRLVKGKRDNGHLFYVRVSPLGNNGEFVEMSEGVADVSIATVTKTTDSEPEVEVVNTSTDETPQTSTVKQRDEATTKLLYDILMNTRNKEAADNWIASNKVKPDVKGISKYFANRLTQMNIPVTQETIDKLLETLSIC